MFGPRPSAAQPLRRAQSSGMRAAFHFNCGLCEIGMLAGEPIDFGAFRGGAHPAGGFYRNWQTLGRDDVGAEFSGPAAFPERVEVAMAGRPFPGSIRLTAAITRTGVVADQLRHVGTVGPGLAPTIPAEEALGVSPLRVNLPFQATRMAAIGQRRQHRFAQALSMQ